MEMRNVAIAVLIGAVLIIAVLAGAWFTGVFRPAGLTANGDIAIAYADGSMKRLSFEAPLGIRFFDVLYDPDTGKTITALTVNVWLQFKVKDWLGRDLQVGKVQYWAQFYVDMEGSMVNGFRSELPMGGWSTTIVGSPYWGKYSTNALMWLGNNVLTAFQNQAVNRYFVERGSGLQAGAINLASVPVELHKALEGVPLAGVASDWLTSNIGTVEVKNFQTENVASWQIMGDEFFKDMMRINWQGVTVGAPGVFTVGAGSYNHMAIGSEYILKFRLALFYRFQDTTGIWSAWQVLKGPDGKPPVLAEVRMKVGNGWYREVTVTPGSNIVAST